MIFVPSYLCWARASVLIILLCQPCLCSLATLVGRSALSHYRAVCLTAPPPFGELAASLSIPFWPHRRRFSCDRRGNSAQHIPPPCSPWNGSIGCFTLKRGRDWLFWPFCHLTPSLNIYFKIFYVWARLVENIICGSFCAFVIFLINFPRPSQLTRRELIKIWRLLVRRWDHMDEIIWTPVRKKKMNGG